MCSAAMTKNKAAESNGNAASNGNAHMTASANGNKKAKKDFHPSDGIKGRWEGVLRPYSNEEVRTGKLCCTQASSAAAGLLLLCACAHARTRTRARTHTHTHTHTHTPPLLRQVEKLRGSLKIEYTLADVAARKLWKYLKEDAFVPALGAVTGNQAMQMVRGGLKSVYCSGWQASTHNNSLPAAGC